MTTNKNSVKHLQDIYFLQFTLAKKTEIKNLGCATHDSVVSVIITQKTNVYDKI